jgi:hypothetical protein
LVKVASRAVFEIDEGGRVEGRVTEVKAALSVAVLLPVIRNGESYGRFWAIVADSPSTRLRELTTGRAGRDVASRVRVDVAETAVAGVG